MLVKFCVKPHIERQFERMVDFLKSDSPLLNVEIWDNDEDNIGLTKARNKLLERTSSEFVCFMDFDLDVTQLNIDWQAMCEKMSQNKMIGLTVPYTLNESGKNDLLEWEEKYYLPCHFMIARRQVIMEELGGLDDRFFVAYQDWDLIKRLGDLGYITLQHNKSLISHYGYSKYSLDKRSLWNADYRQYISKWGKPLEKRNI